MENEQLILKGAPVAEAVTADARRRSDALREQGVIPTLCALRIGERPDDISYETGARKRCEKAGVEFKSIVLPAGASKEEILGKIEEINADRSIHGCLMFRPLSDKTAEKEAAALLSPEKDVDCMNPLVLSSVYTGSRGSFAPCTPKAVMEILHFYGIDIKGKKAVVLGRSLTVGKPAAMMLLEENATVTICHSKSENLKDICRSADILVAAVGRAGMLDSGWLSEGQTVIDVGINVNAEGKLCGDVTEDAKKEKSSAYTPVPGGVGAVTTAVLCRYVVEAAEKRLETAQ